MSTIASKVHAVDARFPGVNNSLLQESPLLLDVPAAMADDDDTTYTFPAEGDTFLPPLAVQVYRHTGGDLTATTTPASTYVVTDGDTLILQIDKDGKGVFEQYTHVYSGVSAGAATGAQIAASINADTAINDKVFCVAGLASNTVTLFPIGPRGAVRVIGGTSVSGLAWPGTTGDAKARVYVSQAVEIAGGDSWSWSYDAATRVLTVKNETGGEVNRVSILVQR